MDGARDGWEERPLLGARLAAYWLAMGRSDEQIVLQLQRDQALDEEAAAAALDQAHRWLRRRQEREAPDGDKQP